jgi:hypothetical protein
MSELKRKRPHPESVSSTRVLPPPSHTPTPPVKSMVKSAAIAVSASSSTGTALTKKGAPTAIASGSAVAKPKKRASRLWADLMPALSAPVLATVAALGFVRMTPVQAATIPLFTTNKDVAVQACTGAIS